MDGSVVEFSPATREARVRFPVHATFFFQFHVFIEIKIIKVTYIIKLAQSHNKKYFSILFHSEKKSLKILKGGALTQGMEVVQRMIN